MTCVQKAAFKSDILQTYPRSVALINKNITLKLKLVE